MIGRAVLTFDLEGANEDEINAAMLDLKRSFNTAAARRYPSYRAGIFKFSTEGRADTPAAEAAVDDPERLFD